MSLIETYQQREEERQVWREHRRAEAREWDAAWLEHAAKWAGVYGSSDPQKVQDALVADGVLFRLADRPTLWIDPNDPRGRR